LKDLVIEHIILYLNKVIIFPILFYDYPNEIGTALDIIKNKYLIKKLKKINYL
jgi:hypothetical protein